MTGQFHPAPASGAAACFFQTRGLPSTQESGCPNEICSPLTCPPTACGFCCHGFRKASMLGWPSWPRPTATPHKWLFLRSLTTQDPELRQFHNSTSSCAGGGNSHFHHPQTTGHVGWGGGWGEGLGTVLLTQNFPRLCFLPHLPRALPLSLRALPFPAHGLPVTWVASTRVRQLTALPSRRDATHPLRQAESCLQVLARREVLDHPPRPTGRLDWAWPQHPN